jgi:hypothetical protein
LGIEIVQWRREIPKLDVISCERMIHQCAIIVGQKGNASMAMMVDTMVDYVLSRGQTHELQPLNFTSQEVFLLQHTDCCTILGTNPAMEVKRFQPPPNPCWVPRRPGNVEVSI